MKDNCGVVFSRVRRNLCFSVSGHILTPNHAKLLLELAISTLHFKFVREDVGKFCTIAITASRHLLLVVVVVAASKEMPKNEFGHIDVLLFVNFHRNTLAVVMHADPTIFGVQIHL